MPCSTSQQISLHIQQVFQPNQGKQWAEAAVLKLFLASGISTVMRFYFRTDDVH